MKFLFTLILFLSVLLASCVISDNTPRELEMNEARYSLTFNATWSAETHPTDFPDSPHFSPLIGAVHNNEVEFWNRGKLASDGIKVMAETGGTSTLAREVNASIIAKKSFAIVSGGGIGKSPGSVELTFITSKDYPLLTLVSMLAPSPDWFTGIHGRSLMKDGKWIDSEEFDVEIYDAGTDSGPQFTSPNSPTSPKENITLLTEGAFAGTGKTVIGTFKLELLEQK